MKKIWITAIALVGINIAVSAQESSELAIQTQAKNELESLVSNFSLNDEAQQQIFNLLVKKHEMLRDTEEPETVKAIINRFNTIIFEELGDDVVQKMKSSPDAFPGFFVD